MLRATASIATAVFVALIVAAPSSLSQTTHKKSGPKRPTAVGAASESSPTKAELIQAARDAAADDMKTITKYRNVQTARVCSARDVATDMYMPHNPEFARCPKEGHRYNVMVRESYQEKIACPPVPTAESAWSVVRLSEDRWRVSSGGRSWEVEEVSSHQLPENKLVRLSNVTLSVTTRGGC